MAYISFLFTYLFELIEEYFAAGSIQITAKGDSGTIKPHLNCSSLISVASLALLISQCNNKHLMTGAEGNSYFVSRESQH